MSFPTYDILIVGCGPAGLSASINTTIRNKKTIIYGGEVCSPKLERAPHVNNYLGFWNISGEELRERFLHHIRQLNIEIVNKKIDNIYPAKGNFNVVSSGDMLICKVIILAVGVQNTKLLPGEEELLGKGVSYCATCDGPLYKGKKVAVIGYDKKSEEEVNYLAEVAKEVIYIPLYEGMGNFKKENIKIVKTRPKSILGKENLQALETESETIEIDGLFIIREAVPPGQLLPELEIKGNSIVVDRYMATNLKGVFAAGDCTGEPYQLAKAVGEGAIAGLSAAAYLDHLDN